MYNIRKLLFLLEPPFITPFFTKFYIPALSFKQSWLLSIYWACGLCLSKKRLNPAGIDLLKVNNARTRFEICSELTIKTMTSFCVFIVYFEHISDLVLMFLLLTLNMQLPAGNGKSRKSVSKTNIFCLNPFHATLAFYTPWKHQKTSGFLMFSGVIERDQWYDMG